MPVACSALFYFMKIMMLQPQFQPLLEQLKSQTTELQFKSAAIERQMKELSEQVEKFSKLEEHLHEIKVMVTDLVGKKT